MKKTFLLILACILSRSSLAAYTWNNVAIRGGGFVTGIVFSPVQSGLAYARTDVGGAYRWDDTNSVWIPLTDMYPVSQGNNLGIESIAADPVNANIVYLAAGMYQASGNGVILRSTDQGASWTSYAFPIPMGGNDMGRGMGERLAIDPNLTSKLYMGGRDGFLYQSLDSGATWAKATGWTTAKGMTGASLWNQEMGLEAVVIDGQGGTSGTASQRIFVAATGTTAGSNLYMSSNGGTTWAVVSGGPSGLMVHHMALGSDGVLWLAYSNDIGPYNYSGVTLVGQIWKYVVSTGVWTNVTPNTTLWSGGMAGGLSVDAQLPGHVIISTLDWYAPDVLIGTTNGGSTWGIIAKPPVSWASTGVSTYNANGVQYWYPGGATTIGTGATNWVEAVALDPFNSDRAFYGTGAGIFMSSNIRGATNSTGAGVIWNFNDVGLEETVPLFLGPSVNGAFLGALGDLGGMRNSSLTTPSTTGEYSNPIDNNTNGLDFAGGNPNIVARVGNSGTNASDVAYSSNNGQSWTPCTAALPGYGGPNQMQSVAVSANGVTIVASPYSGKGSPAWSRNNGSTWTTCTGLPSGAMVAADRVNGMYFYGTQGGKFYMSTDAGKTFAQVGTGTTYNGAPRPVFGIAGEVWIAAPWNGFWRITGLGSTPVVTSVAGASTVYGVGFGAAASGYTHPAVFIIGTVSGQYGFYRCDDGVGATAAAWTRINDTAHQYGQLQGAYIAGDETVFGRVYLTTGGRGYIYGDAPPAGSPTNTPTATRTATQTATRTVSPTATPTPTASPTASPTVTRTSSPTVTSTMTATGTFSPSATATATFSASATRTPTFSPSLTATQTSTRSATSTLTVTSTITGTPTASPTATLTSTKSATGSPTSTLTASPTRSFTPTGTSTITPSFTASPAGSFTNSPTVTQTRTVTLTSSPTSSFTGTPSLTSSPTISATLTATSTSSASPTVSDTTTASPTATPSLTATQSATPTESFTPSPAVSDTATRTATRTLTVSPTATPSPTWTSTRSISSTPSQSPSLTLTPSATPTATFAPLLSQTPTITPSVTQSPTAIPSHVNSPDGPLEIKQVLMVPNPATGNQALISLQLAGSADGLKWSIYTPAMVKVQQSSLIAPMPAGWASEAIDISGLPNGLFYLVVEATRNGGGVSVRKIARLMILR